MELLIACAVAVVLATLVLWLLDEICGRIAARKVMPSLSEIYYECERKIEK